MVSVTGDANGCQALLSGAKRYSGAAPSGARTKRRWTGSAHQPPHGDVQAEGTEMARLPVPPGEGGEQSRLVGRHRPRAASALRALSTALEEDTRISLSEREAVRIRIALANDCHT
jgi:alkylhydroperoxidase family enzyme